MRDAPPSIETLYARRGKTFAQRNLPLALVAISFAAGLNVYATLATLGILAHVRRPTLCRPPFMWSPTGGSSGASVGLFLLEFFADKIPAFDLVWNASAHLHPGSRSRRCWPTGQPPSFRPESKWSPRSAGGLIALAAHGGKTAVRAAVTPSPEPLSNIGLSLGEDALAIFLTWFATRHPYIAAALALCFVAVIVLLVRWVIRALRALFRGAETELVHHERAS